MDRYLQKISPFNLRSETVSIVQAYAEKAFFEYLALRLHCGCYVLYPDEDGVKHGQLVYSEHFLHVLNVYCPPEVNQVAPLDGHSASLIKFTPPNRSRTQHRLLVGCAQGDLLI